MSALLKDEALHEKNQNHPLKGEWDGAYECHIKNHWLLIYELSVDANTLTFVRLGSHAQLFKKFK